MDSELDFFIENSDIEDDSFHSETDFLRQSSDDDDEDFDEIQDGGGKEVISQESAMIGKDGSQWEIITSSSLGRQSSQIISMEKGRPTAYACQRVDKPVTSAFRLLFDESMLLLVKKYTESNARKELNNVNWTVSIDELEKMISIMYFRGVVFSKGISVDDLWSQAFSTRFIQETMTKDRFKELLRFLHFDEKKSARLKLFSCNKFALISEIWNKFIENCLRSYWPGENLVIDEQALSCKAKCRYPQCMSNKIDKFGLKFWIVVDVATKYICNAFSCLGKDDSRSAEQKIGEYVALRLTKPFQNRGRNVTTDNIFTSLQLAKSLQEKETSLVGKISRFCQEIPDELRKGKTHLHATMILRSLDIKNCTLTVYQGKKNKSVMILSTMHPNVSVGEESKKKPETVTFYNSTKYDAHVVNQMTKKYTTKVPCRRWTMHVFYNILDIAAINAWVIYRIIHNNKRIRRKEFILRLAEELRREKEVEAVPLAGALPPPAKRQRCQVGLCKGNKSTNICHTCRKIVCGKCEEKTKIFCKKCKKV